MRTPEQLAKIDAGRDWNDSVDPSANSPATEDASKNEVDIGTTKLGL
jgi:hypothetical protein